MTPELHALLLRYSYFALGWIVGVRVHKWRVRRSYERHLRATARRRGMDA